MDALVSTLFLGAVFGAIYALLAYGLVLTFRASGVFNFAQGALGMFFAFVYYQLEQGGRMNLVVGVYDMRWHLPDALALVVVVLVLAPLFGAALDAVLFRRLKDAGAAVQIVATIGLLIALFGLAGVVWGAASTLTPRTLFGHHVLVVHHVRIPVPEVATIVLVLVLCFGLLAFLRFTPLGVRMRAVVDRPDMARLVGVDADRVSGLSWAMATGFAALAGILIAPFYGSLDARTLTFLVVAATAAAVAGKLESLPFTLAGGLGVGIAQLLTQKYVHGQFGRELRPSIPFIVLFGVLLLPIRWPESASMTAPEEVTPGGEGAGPSVVNRALRLGILGAVLVLPPFLLTGVLGKVLGPDWSRQLVLVPPVALIFLSLVVLVGYAGQISLCHAALAGVSAFLAAHLVVDHHLPFLLAGLVGALLALALGVVLAWRAAHLPPLFLGLASLALGAAIDDVLFTNPKFSNGLAGIRVFRPGFVHGDRAYYLAGLAVFGVAALLVTNLRRGQTGLGLVAMRDTQIGLASVGVSVARLKLISFCLSAFLAGVGGAMLAGARQLATPTDWFTISSLLFLALAVIGGVSRWPGALAGAALFELAAPIVHQPFFQQNFLFRNVFHGLLESLLPVGFGLGAIGLAQNPRGIVEQTREGFATFGRRLERWQLALSGARPVPAAAGAGAAGAGTATLDHPDQLGAPVRLPGASHYHRPSCVLCTGKQPRRLTVAQARRLTPCPICDPPPPALAASSRRQATGATAARSPRDRPLRARPRPAD
jgi:branched-subunit amino acid ABC-type transport system permease component